MTQFLLRSPGPEITQCALTHLSRTSIDANKAFSEHRTLGETLQSLGYPVTKLPPLEDCPDAAFVEDCAISLGKLVILCRPQLPVRQREVNSIEESIFSLTQSEFLRIEAPGTLEGGDVLRIGKTLFVGVGQRTNRDGFEQLRKAVSALGFRLVAVPIQHCLHLKTGVTQIAEDRVLLNPKWIDKKVFHEFEVILIDESEPFAANTLYLSGEKPLVISAGFPKTQEKLQKASIATTTIDLGELAKAEAGVTCCSLQLIS